MNKKLWILLAVVILLLLITGCATDRYMTKEQDAEFKEKCEQTGCIVIQAPMFEKIIKALKSCADRTI